VLIIISKIYQLSVGLNLEKSMKLNVVKHKNNKIMIIKNGNSTVSSNLIHNHNTDEKNLNRQLTRNACKKETKILLIIQLKLYGGYKITKTNFDLLVYRGVQLICNGYYL